MGAGKNGEGSIEVSVTLDDAGVITDVEVTKNGDDAGISDPAVEGVPAAIVAANSLAVDAVAGATLTSNGILEAVEAALTAAGVDPSAYKAAPETDEAEAEKTAVEQTTDVLVIGAGIARPVLRHVRQGKRRGRGDHRQDVRPRRHHQPGRRHSGVR